LGAKLQKKSESTKDFVHNFSDQKSNEQGINHLQYAQKALKTQFVTQTALATPLPPF
jgi:hypothetical protein